MILLPEHVAKKIQAEDAEKQRKQAEEYRNNSLRSRAMLLREELDLIKDDKAKLRRLLSRLMARRSVVHELGGGRRHNSLAM